MLNTKYKYYWGMLILALMPCLALATPIWERIGIDKISYNSQSMMIGLDDVNDKLIYAQENPMAYDSSSILRSLNDYANIKSMCKNNTYECKVEQKKVFVIHLRALSIIDQFYWPEHNPRGHFLKRWNQTVWPPKGAVKGVVFGNVYPESIEDLRLRAQYKEKIALNQKWLVAESVTQSIEEITDVQWPFTNELIASLGLDWIAQDICDVDDIQYIKATVDKVANVDRRTSLLSVVSEAGIDTPQFCRRLK